MLFFLPAVLCCGVLLNFIRINEICTLIQQRYNVRSSRFNCNMTEVHHIQTMCFTKADFITGLLNCCVMQHKSVIDFLHLPTEVGPILQKESLVSLSGM